MTEPGPNTMVYNINRILTVIKQKADIVEELYYRRLHTNGTVRDAYTEVLKTELFEMMKKIDDYKMILLHKMGDIDTEAIMNISQFPNLAGRNSTTE